MLVKKIMTPNVEVLSPAATIREAAAKMKSLDVGAIPIQDNGNTIGIVTDRDIAIRAVADGRDPNKVKVSEVMTSGVTYCHEDDDIDRLREIMEEGQIRRVPVLDRNERLVGIVSLGDLALAAKNEEEEELSGEVLKEVSRPGNSTK